MHLPEAGEVERYHTLTSDVVRAYLERRFSLPASHQTTAEFLDTMRRSPQLKPAQQRLLREFLERCDMAKFARAAPPPEECRQVAEMARCIVRETTPDPSNATTDKRDPS
jgi:DnaJ-domain-containing protein 1